MTKTEDSLLNRTVNLLLIIVLLLCHSPVIYAEELNNSAIIQLEFSEENSIKNITAKLIEFRNDSIGDPIADVDLYFYVERTFSLLPIGDIFNTTDENGEVTIEFPSDLPGDSIGNVNVIVRLEDAEDYSDTESSQIIKWGIPAQIDFREEERSLWSAGANAPISLMLLTNILILVAWGIIFFIMYKLYRISKI